MARGFQGAIQGPILSRTITVLCARLARLSHDAPDLPRTLYPTYHLLFPDEPTVFLHTCAARHP